MKMQNPFLVSLDALDTTYKNAYFLIYSVLVLLYVCYNFYNFDTRNAE